MIAEKLMTDSCDNLEVEHLTEHEKKSILQVLQRDKLESEAESRQFKMDEEELTKIEKQCPKLEPDKINLNICCRCGCEKSIIQVILQQLRICPVCGVKTCTNCMRKHPRYDLCIYCFKLIEIREKWGAWFFDENTNARRAHGIGMIEKMIKADNTQNQDTSVEPRTLNIVTAIKVIHDLYNRVTRGKNNNSIQNQSYLRPNTVNSGNGGSEPQETNEELAVSIENIIKMAEEVVAYRVYCTDDDAISLVSTTPESAAEGNFPSVSTDASPRRETPEYDEPQMDSPVLGSVTTKSTASFSFAKLIIGTIRLQCSLTYGSQLFLSVKRAMGLTPLKSFKSVNSYLKIEMMDGAEVLKKHTTRVVYDSGAPEWQDEFLFHIPYWQESLCIVIDLLEAGPKNKISKLIKLKCQSHGSTILSLNPEVSSIESIELWKKVGTAMKNEQNVVFKFELPLVLDETINGDKEPEIDQKETQSGHLSELGSIKAMTSDLISMASSASISSFADFDVSEPISSLTFGLNYSRRTDQLFIHVTEATGLIFQDDRTPHMSCKITVHPRGPTLNTSIIKSPQPAWNETFDVNMKYVSMIQQTVYIEVIQAGYLKSAGFGVVSILLEDFFSIYPEAFDQTKFMKQPLMTKIPSNIPGEKGSVFVSLRRDVSSACGTFVNLEMKVHYARNLFLSDGRDDANTFVRCFLLPDRKKKISKKSELCRGSNPEWKFNCTWYNLTMEDLRYHRCIEMSVWARGTTKEFIGGLRIGVSHHPPTSSAQNVWFDSNSAESAVWNEMLAVPGTWCNATIPLRHTLIPHKFLSTRDSIDKTCRFTKPSTSSNSADISVLLQSSSSGDYTLCIEIISLECQVQPNVCRLSIQCKSSSNSKQINHLFPQESDQSRKKLCWNATATFADISSLNELKFTAKFYYQPLKRRAQLLKDTLLSNNLVGFFVFADAKLIADPKKYTLASDGSIWNYALENNDERITRVVHLRPPLTYASFFVQSSNILSISKKIKNTKKKESGIASSLYETQADLHQSTQPNPVSPDCDQEDSLYYSSNMEETGSLGDKFLRKTFSFKNYAASEIGANRESIDNFDSTSMIFDPNDSDFLFSPTSSVLEGANEVTRLSNKTGTDIPRSLSHKVCKSIRSTVLSVKKIAKKDSSNDSLFFVSSDTSSPMSQKLSSDQGTTMDYPSMIRIDVNLFYNSYTSSLIIGELKTSPIPPSETNKSYDCYYTATLLPNTNNNWRKKSKVVKETTAPSWENEVEFFVDPIVLNKRILILRLYHHRLSKDLSFGQAVINMKDVGECLYSKSGFRTSNMLSPKKEIDYNLTGFDVGEILIIVGLKSKITSDEAQAPDKYMAAKRTNKSSFKRFNSIKTKLQQSKSFISSFDSTTTAESTDHELSIVVVECRNLVNLSKTSKAYCKIQLISSKATEKAKQKTSTCNPKPTCYWNEKIVFGVNKASLPNQSIEFNIYDEEKQPVLLAGCHLNNGDLSEPWKDANDMEKDIWNKLLAESHSEVQLILPLRLNVE